MSVGRTETNVAASERLCCSRKKTAVIYGLLRSRPEVPRRVREWDSGRSRRVEREQLDTPDEKALYPELQQLQGPPTSVGRG